MNLLRRDNDIYVAMSVGKFPLGHASAQQASNPRWQLSTVCSLPNNLVQRLVQPAAHLSELEVSSSPCSFPSLPHRRSYLVLFVCLVVWLLFFVFVSFSKQKESMSGKEEKAESFTT